MEHGEEGSGNFRRSDHSLCLDTKSSKRGSGTSTSLECPTNTGTLDINMEYLGLLLATPVDPKTYRFKG